MPADRALAKSSGRHSGWAHRNDFCGLGTLDPRDLGESNGWLLDFLHWCIGGLLDCTDSIPLWLESIKDIHLAGS